jgi:Lon protease-like protein
MLKNLCLTFFPQEYEAREVESQAEKASWSTLLPIFYYNDCQFPGYVLRLHLFEPRYKTMMQRIVNTTRCFAYVPNFDNYRANIGDVALIARITECEFMPGF